MTKRAILSLLAGLLVLTAHAEDLHTRDGTVYYNYKVIGHDAESITIIHSEGGGKVPLSQLPDDLQKKYGYQASGSAAASVASAPATNTATSPALTPPVTPAPVAGSPAAATPSPATSVPALPTVAPAPPLPTVPAVGTVQGAIVVTPTTVVAPEPVAAPAAPSADALAFARIDEKSMPLAKVDAETFSAVDRAAALKLLRDQLEKLKPDIASARQAYVTSDGGTMATGGQVHDQRSMPRTGPERILRILRADIRALEMTETLPPAVVLTEPEREKTRNELVDVFVKTSEVNPSTQNLTWYSREALDLEDAQAEVAVHVRQLEHKLGIWAGDDLATNPPPMPQGFTVPTGEVSPDGKAAIESEITKLREDERTLSRPDGNGDPKTVSIDRVTAATIDRQIRWLWLREDRVLSLTPPPPGSVPVASSTLDSLSHITDKSFVLGREEASEFGPMSRAKAIKILRDQISALKPAIVQQRKDSPTPPPKTDAPVAVSYADGTPRKVDDLDRLLEDLASYGSPEESLGRLPGATPEERTLDVLRDDVDVLLQRAEIQNPEDMTADERAQARTDLIKARVDLTSAWQVLKKDGWRNPDDYDVPDQLSDALAEDLKLEIKYGSLRRAVPPLPVDFDPLPNGELSNHDKLRSEAEINKLELAARHARTRRDQEDHAPEDLAGDEVDLALIQNQISYLNERMSSSSGRY